MRKLLLISFLVFVVGVWSCFVQDKRIGSLYELQNSPVSVPIDDSVYIVPAPATDQGNAEAGYLYLTEGNAFSTGIPNGLYRLADRMRHNGVANITGYNKFDLNGFVVFKNQVGNEVATPGCLHCHAQKFNDDLIVGLGNSFGNFQLNSPGKLKILLQAVKLLYGKNSPEWKTAQRSFESVRVLNRRVQTEMRGPAVAQKIGEIMASHRDPVTLEFRADTSYFTVPAVVIPEDVPAWWITKKRKAFTVNAMRQGSFLKHLMSPTIITLRDSAEAREIYDHMPDVWAYIETLQPPRYPFAIDPTLATEGKRIFVNTCARCHGTYDAKPNYPNKIVSPAVIGTDSLMWKYFLKYPEGAGWFNRSWFATSTAAAYLKPQAGYVAPALDGVWITAPYFHNGSVPTIQSVLNSRERPRYWRRNFDQPEYDYKKLGWRYKSMRSARGRSTYNTDIPGYGNYGHQFGDNLTKKERDAVVEYLKTL